MSQYYNSGTTRYYRKPAVLIRYLLIVPLLTTIYDMSVEGDCNGLYEGSSKIP